MDMINKIDALRKLTVFANSQETDLNLLAERASFRLIPKFQYIYMPNEVSQHVFLLIAGQVRVGTFSADNREVTKEIIKATDLLGGAALSGGLHYADFAQSMHESIEVLCFKTTDLSELCRTNHAIALSMMHYLSNRVQRMDNKLMSMVVKDARERIISFLVESAGAEGRQVGSETLLKHYLTQQDIAHLTCTSRQTVTSLLNELRKDNLIYFNRNSILIRDVRKLA
jgi:CRP/FNR family transcriptional regulator, cyclic AMP receptor protein